MKRLTNIKTTMAGVAALAIGVLLKTGLLDLETAMAGATIATALGFLAAKDHNVTGGTKSQDKPKDPQP